MDAQTVEVVEKSLKSITWEKGLWALAIAIICYIAIRLIMRFSNHALDRLPLDKTLSGFVRAAMRVVLYFVAGIIVAGALGVQLGGAHTYFGKQVKKPVIGDANREIERADIARAIGLMYGCTVIFAALMLGLAVIM